MDERHAGSARGGLIARCITDIDGRTELPFFYGNAESFRFRNSRIPGAQMAVDQVSEAAGFQHDFYVSALAVADDEDGNALCLEGGEHAGHFFKDSGRMGEQIGVFFIAGFLRDADRLIFGQIGEQRKTDVRQRLAEFLFEALAGDVFAGDSVAAAGISPGYGYLFR